MCRSRLPKEPAAGERQLDPIDASGLAIAGSRACKQRWSTVSHKMSRPNRNAYPSTQAALPMHIPFSMYK